VSLDRALLLLPACVASVSHVWGRDVAGLVSKGRQRSKQRTAGHHQQTKETSSLRIKEAPLLKVPSAEQLRPTEAAVARPRKGCTVAHAVTLAHELPCQQRTLNPHFGTGGLRKRKHPAPKSRLPFCGRSSPPASHTPSASRLEFRSPNGNCTATAKVCHQHRFRGDRVR